MNLVIRNCPDIGFILYIIKFLRHYIINTIDYRQLIKFDNYFEQIQLDISAKYIILSAIKYLTYKRFSGGRYEIYINENIKVENIKLISLCKLINYGNLSVPAYSIFTDAFNYAAENIELLYYRYTRGF